MHETQKTHLILAKLGVAALELKVDVAREVAEPAERERRELLASLVPLGVKLATDREERFCAAAERNVHEHVSCQTTKPPRSRTRGAARTYGLLACLRPRPCA